MAKNNTKDIIDNLADDFIDKGYNPLLKMLRENDKKNLFKTNVVTAFHKTGFALFDHYFGAVVNIHDENGKIVKQEPRVGQAAGTFNLVIANTGAGKCLPVSTRVPSPNGWTTMGDIKVGDSVFTVTGDPTKVLGVYPQGKKDIYKIHFSDGRTALCSEDHLWEVVIQSHRGDTHKVLDLKTIMKDYKRNDTDPYRHYRIPVLEGPVQYNHQDVPIDPYVLGAFIGNGCCTENDLSLSSGDIEIPKKVARICGFTTARRKGTYTYVFFDKKGNKVRTRDFFKEIPEVIGCHSRDKSIPNQYMLNDVDTRMSLLQGLMDTDGSISYNQGRYNVKYSSCSKKLLEQMQELIRSLGYNANIGIPDKRSEKYINGYHGTMVFQVPNFFKSEMFTCGGKALLAFDSIQSSIERRNRNYKYIYITEIEYSHQEEAVCIYVDHPSHLYAIDQFIVTHNTTFVSQVAANIIRQYPYSNVIHFDCEDRFDVSRCETITKLPASYFESERYMIRTGAVGLDVIQEMIVKTYVTKTKLKNELMVDSGFKDEFGNPVRIYMPTVIIIDSMTTVMNETFNPDNAKEASEAEKMRGNTEGARDSKTLKGFFKDILPLCKEANIIIYGINHINQNMSMNAFIPVAKQQNYLKQDESIPGGKSMLYYPFNIIKLTAKPSDDFTEEADGFAGHIVMFEPIKSSSNQSGNNSKGISFEMVFSHKYGFDPLRTLIHYGKDNGLIEGNRTRMKFKDDPSFTFSMKNLMIDVKEHPIMDCLKKYVIPTMDKHLSYIEPENVSFDEELLDY